MGSAVAPAPRKILTWLPTSFNVVMLKTQKLAKKIQDNFYLLLKLLDGIVYVNSIPIMILIFLNDKL
jgi:hypothetical protein